MSTDVKSNPADLRGVVTKRVQVDEIGPDGLIEIREGVQGEFAVGVADALDSCVRDALHDGVQGGLDANRAYLCAFAMQVSKAIRAAAGVEA